MKAEGSKGLRVREMEVGVMVVAEVLRISKLKGGSPGAMARSDPEPRIVINSPQPRDIKRSDWFVVINFIIKKNRVKK